MKMVNQRAGTSAALRWATVLLGVVLVTGVKASPPRADLFSDLFARGTAKQRAMHSLSARFTETTTSTLLVKPLVAHGMLVAATPAKVRMTYAEPEAKTITMDGRVLTVSWADRRERQQMNISETQKRIDHYFTNASEGELRSMFEIVARPDGDRRDEDLVDMRPKRKQIAKGLARLELWIDRRSDLLTRMRLTFPSGDQKTIALEDITVNVPVADEMFRQ